MSEYNRHTVIFLKDLREANEHISSGEAFWIYGRPARPGDSEHLRLWLVAEFKRRNIDPNGPLTMKPLPTRNGFEVWGTAIDKSLVVVK